MDRGQLLRFVLGYWLCWLVVEAILALVSGGWLAPLLPGGLLSLLPVLALVWFLTRG